MIKSAPTQHPYFIAYHLLFFFLPFTMLAQQPITLEDIWKKGTFSAKNIPGFTFQKDGRHYTRLEGTKINQYDFTTGNPTAEILDGATLKDNPLFKGTIDAYSFSDDEQKMILATENEPLYRRSSFAKNFIYDTKAKTVTTLYPEVKQRYATFNPAADKVAWVSDNNLFYKDLTTNQVTQITTDGKENSIVNGASDWVYEEEFRLVRGFEWSPDGKKIAFFRFDETLVPEFTLDYYIDGAYPEKQKFKYPKVGENNALVSVHIYSLDNRETYRAIGGEKDVYYPRIKWTQNADVLCITRLNRLQNELELHLADTKTRFETLLMKETNKYYLDITDDLAFLKDGKNFIWTSEQSGFNHIYLYGMDGKKIKDLTPGDFDVTNLYGIDEANTQLFYQAHKVNAAQKEIYSLNWATGEDKGIATVAGSNDAEFSNTFDYFVNTYSNANSAPTFTVYNRKGEVVRTIEDNARLKPLQADYGVAPVEFFSFKTSEGTDLNGWMIKPTKMKKRKKHPVLMYVYGGPGSQQVTDAWKGANYWWFQLLAQKGYVVAGVDNRGTGGRGEEFKKMTYLQLGKYETQDQIEAAKWLGQQKYIDPARIGIFGWSYGGYMSSLCIFKGADVFKSAIAVAPVTNWKWYDSVYTERYMQTEKENKDGYQQNSPVYFADRLKGNYLLLHGMADDNVHFQNTAELANALLAANKQYDTYFYPNRNHGIFGGNARLHLYTKMTNFLLEKL